jgi:hypothetical protein
MSPMDVVVSRGGGPVSVRVTMHQPGGVLGVVWRFRRPSQRVGAAGEISRGMPEVPLGPPDAIDGWGFLVDGYVVPPSESSGSPYQVVVTVLQGGQVVHQAVPADQGSGTFADAEVRFRYPFRIRVVPRAPRADARSTGLTRRGRRG